VVVGFTDGASIFPLAQVGLRAAKGDGMSATPSKKPAEPLVALTREEVIARLLAGVPICEIAVRRGGGRVRERGCGGEREYPG
jgi:hypothetical protein